MSDRFLTDEELTEATGSPQKSLQKEVLTQNGIFLLNAGTEQSKRPGFILTIPYSAYFHQQAICLLQA